MTAAREEFADEVCGFGLLGIVLVNAPFIGTCGDGTATSPASGGRGRRCNRCTRARDAHLVFGPGARMHPGGV